MAISTVNRIDVFVLNRQQRYGSFYRFLNLITF
jgi:hypothetical protein